MNFDTDKKVFILILNYNSCEETTNLLARLQELTYNNLKIIVIDNNSTDDSVRKLVQHTGSIKLIRNRKNLGYAGGNNIGIEIAINEQADYIWILNPDIGLTPETLSILVDNMNKDNSLAAIGPRICYHEKPDIIYSDGGLIFPEKGFFVTHKNHNKNVKDLPANGMTLVDYANGSAILIRTKTLQEIGKFREDFFLYYEETDWCLRAKRNGWHIATNSNAMAYHKSSTKGFSYHFFYGKKSNSTRKDPPAI